MPADDKKTFVIELEKPFGLVLDALGKPSSNVPFIMPARLAATDPNEQVKEPIGSGPFKFSKDEWQPGNHVVYVRNPDYVPRKEKPSGAAGGKHASGPGGVALHPGRRHGRERARGRRSRLLGDPVRRLRPAAGEEPHHHRLPPRSGRPHGLLAPITCIRRSTTRRRGRRCSTVDQKNYLQAVIGQAKYYKTCPGIFMCGVPYETTAGAPKRTSTAPASC